MHRLTLEHLLTLRSNRRRLIASGVAGAIAISYRGMPTDREASAQTQSPVADHSTTPFTLGVASGDPLSESVVIWTRLAPLPLDGGGMEPGSIDVRWEVATDDHFRSIVRSGSATATEQLAHSVHVDVTGLLPGRDYFYRFAAGDWLSPTGRTRTAPAPGPLDLLRFGFASCANWEHGYFSAYGDLAGQDIELVVFLGDYLYEYAPASDYSAGNDDRLRVHTPGEAVDLVGYRNRHAQYKTDPNLQLAHHQFPWIVTWDDHEVSNNYAGSNGPDGVPESSYLDRRADAYQAFYEHMPLRPESMPAGPGMGVFRRLRFGDLASFHVLDTRQYRTGQPCSGIVGPRCDAIFDSAATMLGAAQERWLLDGLATGDTRWNILAQQVMMGELEVGFVGEPLVNDDQWDGYPLARQRLLGAVAEQNTGNVVVLTGDAHSAWVHDLKTEFSSEVSPIVATEFVTTSISARNPIGAPLALALPGNPHIRFLDLRHGYTLCELSRDQWRTTFRATDSVLDAQATYEPIATYVVEHGNPGAVPE